MGSTNTPLDEEAVPNAAAPGEAPAAEAGEAGGEEARLRAQLEDCRSKLLYTLADFDNYKKRIDREKAESRAYANESLVLELLDVYENLGRALEASSKPEAQAAQIAKGLEMVYGQMRAVLEKHGLEPIVAVGKPFDPRTMEAMMQEASPIDEDTVLEEFQRGYKLHSKVIRCAKVKVSKR